MAKSSNQNQNDISHNNNSMFGIENPNQKSVLYAEGPPFSERKHLSHRTTFV